MTAQVFEASPGGARCRSASANHLRRLSLPAQFLRYLICAGLAALVNFGTGSILVDRFGLTSAWTFPLAVAAAYVAGMAVNFLLNRHFTFASDRSGIAQGRTFIVVALSGLAVTILIASGARPMLAAAGEFARLLPDPLGTPEALSRAIAIGIASIYSFTAHKYLTFNSGIRMPLLRVVRALHFGG